MKTQNKCKILSIIPARGGSKGLIGKNLISLNKKPLIAWTIEASLNSQFITTTVVTSDDQKILETALQYGVKSINRPKELATDTAKIEDVIFHTIGEMDKQELSIEYIILLQPTSPLRTSDDIDDAFETLFRSNATNLISLKPYDNKILKCFVKNKKGWIQGISNNSYPFSRRQDLPDVYMSNGAIYITRKDMFIKNKSLISNKTIPYIMTQNKSIDIDSKNDLITAERIMLEAQNLSNN